MHSIDGELALTEAPSRDGGVVWITGLSGSGKTTLASSLVPMLRAQGKEVVFLDGDELREVFGDVQLSSQSYERLRRLELAMRYARLCRMLASQGVVVVIATISLFAEVHAWNRAQLPGYFEVYLKTPIHELRRRDPKSIYRRFDAGELSNVSGLDLPVDEPKAADWVVEFEPGRSVKDLAQTLLLRLTERKLV